MQSWFWIGPTQFSIITEVPRREGDASRVLHGCVVGRAEGAGVGVRGIGRVAA